MKNKMSEVKYLGTAFLFCVLTAIAIKAAPPLRAKGKIAFTNTCDSAGDIYVMNAVRTNQNRFTRVFKNCRVYK